MSGSAGLRGTEQWRDSDSWRNQQRPCSLATFFCFNILFGRHRISVGFGNSTTKGNINAWTTFCQCHKKLNSSITRVLPSSTSNLDDPCLRTGLPLVDGLSCHGVSGLRMNSLAHGLSGGIQARGPGSLALGVGQPPVIHTPSVAISVVSSVEHSTTTTGSIKALCRRVRQGEKGVPPDRK